MKQNKKDTLINRSNENCKNTEAEEMLQKPEAVRFRRIIRLDAPEPPKYKCCICGKEEVGWGNNPYPLRRTGKCCDECNATKVVPMRILEIITEHKKKEKRAK